MKALQISYLKLADTPKGKRVWLQGLRLDEAGYDIGQRYTISYDEDNCKAVLSLSQIESEADRKVSRKKVGDRFYPLIDIVNRKLADLFSGVERVQVIVGEGSILIQYHPMDKKRVDREDRLARKIRNGQVLSMASMAHGAGILDYYLHKGLEERNVRTGMIWAVEPEQVYLQTSLNNNPSWSYDSLAIEGRIEDIDAGDLKSPDLVIAGLPCTGCSRAGLAKNQLKFAEQHESAGTAFIGFLMAIKELAPGVVILENVPGYSSTVSMHMIRETLQSWRYNVHEIIVNRELGAFEDRRRLCMVAVSEGIDFEFDLKPVREREQTLGEILDDVPPDADCWNPCEYLEKKRVRDKAAGKGFKMQIVDEDSDRVGTVGRSYHKWRSTEPLVQHPTDPKLKRLLTVNELCQVKTIDQNLVDGMSRTRQIEMLGQSVLGAAFQAVGRNLGECLTRQFAQDVSSAA